MASSLSLGARKRTDALTADHSTTLLPPPGAEGPLPRYHPAPSRNEVAIVQPVLVKQLENDILTAVAFLPRWLLTATKVRPCEVVDSPTPSDVAEEWTRITYRHRRARYRLGQLSYTPERFV